MAFRKNQFELEQSPTLGRHKIDNSACRIELYYSNHLNCLSHSSVSVDLLLERRLLSCYDFFIVRIWCGRLDRLWGVRQTNGEDQLSTNYTKIINKRQIFNGAHKGRVFVAASVHVIYAPLRSEWDFESVDRIGRTYPRTLLTRDRRRRHGTGWAGEMESNRTHEYGNEAESRSNGNCR